MLYYSELLSYAEKIGFSHISKLNIDSLIPMQEVRDMCAADKCHAYGKLWSCPPACGSIEFTTKRINNYSDGIIVQTTGNLDDDFDYASIQKTHDIHIKHFDTLVRCTKKLSPDCLPLTAGGCNICIKCTYPDRPCRFPNRMMFSMEAYGLLVSDICIKSNLQYNYGHNTITFTSCILTNKKEGIF